ncbi:metallopeptidase family protein [Altericroceibacterium spongiae]|uniref:Metallopeptidase family protein n=1 Tax=Altericroceibacterium spongiae TaxID=2320269 RepID=A0A420EKE0_9SPHN|nr:metallopeptidase family protein [Altericroceibacterium spongiae]RKF21066.1 metallopeptidase family protein [Altericroceibacterium spongiae]
MELHPLPGPSGSEIETLAFRVFRAIPSPFAEHLIDIEVRVEEFADQEALHAVGLDNPWQLVGLYQGHPIDKQSVWASGDLPPLIRLFRSPLLLECRERQCSLGEMVRHVVVHEVGHHFGFSDDDMHALEDETD